jgi:hypothetical protein
LKDLDIFFGLEIWVDGPEIKRLSSLLSNPSKNQKLTYPKFQQDQLLASMNSGPPPAKRHSISALPPSNIQPQQLAPTLNHPLALLQSGATGAFPPHFAAAAAQVAAQAAQQQLGKAGQAGAPYLSLPTIPPAFVLKQAAPMRPALSNGVSPAASVASGEGQPNVANLLGLPGKFLVLSPSGKLFSMHSNNIMSLSEGGLNLQQLQHLLLQQQRNQLAAQVQQQAVQRLNGQAGQFTAQHPLHAAQTSAQTATTATAPQLMLSAQFLQMMQQQKAALAAANGVSAAGGQAAAQTAALQQQVAAMAFLQQQHQQQVSSLKFKLRLTGIN